MWQPALLATLALPWAAVAAPAQPGLKPRQNAPLEEVTVNVGGEPPLPTTQVPLDVAFGPTSAIAPTIGAPAPTGIDPEAQAASLANNAPPLSIVGGDPAAAGPQWGATPGEYLYVWAGVEGRGAPDRLVTLDFRSDSPSYGRIVSQVDVGTSGNEPHHCGLSFDKKRLLCGGFFSFLKRQNDIFVFDLTDPAHPTFVRSTAGIQGAVHDDFIPLKDNTFILSEMGNKNGGTGGRVARIDSDGRILQEYPRPGEPFPDREYNPHGVAVREDLNLFVSSDFLDASTALNRYPGDPVMRDTVRVWDLAQMRILFNFRFPKGTGTMDTKLFHQSSVGMGYVGGTGNGKIYYFNVGTRVAQLAIDLTKLIVPPHLQRFFPIDSQMMQISPDDTRFYIPYASKNDKWTGKSGFYSGIAVFDVTVPAYPRLIQNLAMPRYAGPHLGQLYGNRFVTAGYFVDFDGFGKVHLNGDHVVRCLHVRPDGTLYPDTRFQVDFNRLIPGIQMRPHGLATVKQ